MLIKYLHRHNPLLNIKFRSQFSFIFYAVGSAIQIKKNIINPLVELKS